ncbi:MAG TPA: LysM peptidoglycan-binding domain-containing M23 family metallopeptidase [Candidatus Binatus sp.]|nr:LysM peptidoglycan-binding domain-containing M23 family metallopeptidase [Candidatus Binatus sp.]
MRRRGGVGVVVAAVVCVMACGGPAGVRHRVAPGETLYRIGKAYGVPYDELARVNGIADPARIEVGRTIVIPHARAHLPVGVITPVSAEAERPAPRELPEGPAPFIWPVTGGLLTSDFGARGASHHDGIDIGAPVGTPVRAVRAGRVLYSDRLRGYGNLIIVDHGEGYATVYAHNRDNRARTGDQVRQGDVIASVGETGRTSGPNLHFEVRKDNVARNPLFYLPGRPQRAAEMRSDVVEGTP